MGQFDGQGANAFVQGMQGGYGFVDKAVNSKQNRDNAQRVADQQSVVAEQKIRAREQIEQETQGGNSMSPQQQQQVQAADENMKADTATKSATAITGIMGALDVEENDEAIANANTQLSNSPALQKVYGLTANDKIESLDLNQPKDNQAYTDYLGKMGVTPANMGYDLETVEGKESWENLKGELQPQLSMIKAGGQYIDMENLAAGTGASKRVSGKQNEKMKNAKIKQQTTVKKAQHKQADATLTTLQTELKAVGVNLNTANLKTIDQKNQAIEDGQKKLQGSAFTPVVEGESRPGHAESDAQAAKLRNAMKVLNGEGDFVEGKPKKGETSQVDGVTTSTTPDETIVVQKAGEQKGTTENTATQPDGTTVTTVTQDQELGGDSVATKNAPQVEAVIQQSVETKKPMDETRMRHLYALAGMTYPIPDKGAKAKQYEFLVANGLDKKTAMSWTFEPSSKGANRKPSSYDNYISAFLASKDGMPTKTEWQQVNADWVTKSSGGVKDVRDQRDLMQLEGNFRDVANFKTKYMNKPNEAKGADLGSMRSIEESNAQNSPNIKARIKKPVEEMRLRHGTINSIDSLTSDLDGTLRTATRGPIENLVQSFKKVIGGDNMSPEMEATMKKTIERDTRTGMILAEFLRATSGLTVTEEERKFLGNIMTGGNWSDEKSLMTAIKSFRDQTAEQNDVAAGTLMNDAPYSATIYRQYDTYKTADSQSNNSPKPSGGSGGGKPSGGGSSSPKTKKRISDLFKDT